MQKLIKFDNTIIVVLDNGASYQKSNVSEDELNILMNPDTTEEQIIDIVCPKIKEIKNEIKEAESLLRRASNSKLLSVIRNSVYWEEISLLSIPKELVEAILNAEDEEDTIKLETYKNFWTLMSLNPDEQCRLNLFWFLNKWGLKISRSGFFVAYRNVDIKEKGNTIEDTIFTDNYTHTFNIKIGEMVTLDRKKCDSDSNVSCSRGLNV